MMDYKNSLFSLWPFGLAYCLFLVASLIYRAYQDRKR